MYIIVLKTTYVSINALNFNISISWEVRVFCPPVHWMALLTHKPCVDMYCTKLEVKFTSADIFNFVLKYFYILKWIFDKYQRTL